MRKAIPTAVVCLLVPALAWGASATVQSGVRTRITTHARFDNQCQPKAVEIQIVAAPANGTLTSEPEDFLVPEQNARGERQPRQCVGKKIAGVAVYYQSKPGFAGSDDVRYRRVTTTDPNDRFNIEISYTISVTAAPAPTPSPPGGLIKAPGGL